MARQSIGEFLATLRKEKGYTQQEVADMLDVSNRTVSAWEKDKAMPDILLLPAIAELYGISVDEMLKGARKESESEVPSFSAKAERSLILKKLSRFTLQSYILLGVSIIGQLFFFWGWYNHLFGFVNSEKFDWALFLMAIGTVAVVVAFTVLFALWKSCESSVDNSQKDNKDFCALLSQRVAIHFYVACGISFVLAFVMLLLFKIGIPGVLMCTTYIVSSFVFILVGTLLYNHKLSALSDSVSQVKQSRTTMFCCLAASCLFALFAFAACKFSLKPFDEFQAAIVSVCLLISFALLLMGTLLFNSKLPANTKENAAFFVQASYSMTVCCYVLSALYFVLPFLSMINCMWYVSDFLLIVMLFVLSLTSLLLGSLLRRRDLINLCGEEMRERIKRNNKLYLKVVLCGLIPFFVGLITACIGWLSLLNVYFIEGLITEISAYGGIAIILLDIAVCLTICLVKRERTNAKQ